MRHAIIEPRTHFWSHVRMCMYNCMTVGGVVFWYVCSMHARLLVDFWIHVGCMYVKCQYVYEHMHAFL